MKSIIYILNYYNITYNIKTYSSITYLIISNNHGSKMYIKSNLTGTKLRSSFYEQLLYIFKNS